MVTITEALTLALDHHLAGRLGEAQALYTRVLDNDPDQPDALHFLGVLAGQVGQPDVGLDLIGRALGLRPEAADIHANRANILRLAGRGAEAALAYRQALALQPDFAEAWTDLAGVHRMLGDADAAIAGLETALRIAPGLGAAAERLAALLHERGRLLVEAGRGVAAVAALSRAAQLAPLNADIAFLSGNALYAIGLREDSLAAYRHAVALVPDYLSAMFNLGVALGRTDRLGEAAGVLARAARIDPSWLEAQESLTLTRYALGRMDEAGESASRVLALKDALSVAQAPHVPPLPASPRNAAARARNVIAFSLWGELEVHTRGMVENARLAPLLYPGWVCRVYHDGSVPAAVLRDLAEAGAELVPMEPGSGPQNGLYWRFAVSDDPSVARFLCRSCDARLSAREQAAVGAWIASGKPFHVMRDQILHTDPMQGGLWGGMAGLLPDLRPLAERFVRTDADHRQDERFLRRFVWPLIRTRALVHDGVHPGHGQPFPDGPDGPLPGRVGERVDA